MSFSTPEKAEKINILNIPEILADFFLRKIDMPSYSDDSDHKHKSKRKKSRHKKHKKSKYRHGDDNSDSSSESPDLNTKAVVDDVSSSEEMGIQRLKKIKNMKLQCVNKPVSQTASLPDQEVTSKSDMSNSSTSKNLEFYGPSVALWISGTEPNNSSKKVSSEDNKSNDLKSDLNKKDSAFKNNSNISLSKQNNVPSSDLCIPLLADSNEIHSKSVQSMPDCDEIKPIYDQKIKASKRDIILEKTCEIRINSVSEKTDSKENYKISDKHVGDSKQNDSHLISRNKKADKEKKSSRSHSRSKSHSRHRSPKSNARRTSRSSSRDSYRSRRKRKKHSSSHSRERSKSHKYKKRSHSRSRSESKYEKRRKNSRSLSWSTREKRSRRRSRSRSQEDRRSRRRSNSRRRRQSYSRNRKRSSSKSRHRSRSRRRSASLSRSRSKSKTRQSRRSYSRNRERSSSKSRHRSRSRRRSRSRSKAKTRRKSRSKEKSHSRSKSREKRSFSNKIDQAKILETARKNVLKMMQNGTLPEGLPVENLKKEQFISIQSGGKSVQELTDFCQRLSQKENEPDDKDKPDDETGFIHHPFKVKEPGVIKLIIKNAVQLPIKTHAQKVAETARLSSQFPVSSGNQHKQKELEWIPVVPASSKSAAKPVKTNVSSMPVNTVANSNKTVEILSEPQVLSTPSPVTSIPMPVSYLPSSSEVPAVKTLDVMPLVAPLPPPPLPPLLESPMQLPTLFHIPIQPVMPSYMMPSQEMMNSYRSTSALAVPSVSVFKPPKKLDIPAIVAKRFQALTKLQQDPNDPDALKVMHDAHKSIQEWVESQQVPGLFTGSTDAKMLTAAELCGPKYHKFRKDILSHAPPVTEGKGMSLLKKMGWNPGEGLGKNKEGNLEPLMLDIKTDKKGLVSEGENSKKSTNSFVKELQGKHPVSALMELCSKRRWKPPLYTCVMDRGPPHKKLFCFKVEVNGVEYQPLNPCSNKKVAKADAAVLCLQSLNILSKTV